VVNAINTEQIIIPDERNQASPTDLGLRAQWRPSDSYLPNCRESHSSTAMLTRLEALTPVPSSGGKSRSS